MKLSSTTPVGDMLRKAVRRGLVPQPASIATGRIRAVVLAEEISATCGVSTARILGTDRDKYSSHARQRLFVELFRAGYSIADVGSILKRDHSTVIYGMRKVLGDDVYDAEVAARYPEQKNLRSKKRAA